MLAEEVNGRTPISRCEDATRFQHAVDIDLPGVRVIADPVGSNEPLTNADPWQHLSQAKGEYQRAENRWLN